MTEALRALVDKELEREKDMREFLERVRNAPDRGTGGKITWTRDELHER
jgi:hypothetical protein